MLVQCDRQNEHGGSRVYADVNTATSPDGRSLPFISNGETPDGEIDLGAMLDIMQTGLGQGNELKA